MPVLHELQLGSSFDDLLVEVFALEGVDAASKPKDPVYSALVRDPTGFARLVYRSTNKCSPSAVKKGKFYLVAGARGAWDRCHPSGARHTASLSMMPHTHAALHLAAGAASSTPWPQQMASRSRKLRIRMTNTWPWMGHGAAAQAR
jgi:hypothetical protein